MFLEDQMIILEWFLNDHVTEDWSDEAENSALITGINNTLLYIHRKPLFCILIK